MDEWLIRQVNLLGVPLQNWMVVNFALALIAALVNLSEKDHPPHS